MFSDSHLQAFLTHIAVFVFVLHVATNAIGQEEREWTDASGNKSISATLIKAQEDVVTLQKSNGQTITLQISKLSAKDQEYLLKLDPTLDIEMAKEPEDVDRQDYASDSIPFAAVTLGDETPYVMPALAFDVQNEFQIVVVPTRPIRSSNPFGSSGRWSIQTDINSTDKGEPATSTIWIADESKMLLKTKRIQVPAIKSAEVDSLQTGAQVVVHVASGLQGKNSRLKIKVIEAEVLNVERVDGMVSNFTIDYQTESEDDLCVVANVDGEVFGVIRPYQAVVTKQAKPKRGTRVLLVSSLLQPKAPILISLSSAWNVNSDGTRLHLLMVADRELDDDVVANVDELRTVIRNRSRREEHIILELDEAALALTPIDAGDANPWMALFPELSVDDGQFLYKATLNVDEDFTTVRQVMLKASLTVNDAENVELTHHSNQRWMYVQEFNRLQPGMLGSAAFWESHQAGFKSDDRVTSAYTAYRMPLATNPAPKLAEPTTADSRGEAQKSDSGQFARTIDASERVQFVFSADEKVCWLLIDGLVRRMELPNLRETARARIFENTNSNTRKPRKDFLQISDQGVLVGEAGRGIHVLDFDTLERKRWIPVNLLYLTASPFGKYAYALMRDNVEEIVGDIGQFAFLAIIDTETGLPVHRIKNQFAIEHLPAKASDRRGNRFGLSGIRVSRDGRYLYGRSMFVCRFRIDGSELFFEERSPIYLTQYHGLDLSSDGKYVIAPFPQLDRYHNEIFGKANLDFAIKGDGRKGQITADHFLANDLSAPLRSDIDDRPLMTHVASQNRLVHWEQLKPSRYRTDKDTIYRGHKRKRYPVSYYLPKTEQLLVWQSLSENSSAITFGPPTEANAETDEALPNSIAFRREAYGKTWIEGPLEFTEIKLANVNPRRPNETMPSTDTIPGTVWSADGAYLFMGARSGNVRKIEIESGQITHELDLPGELLKIVLTSEGLCAITDDSSRGGKLIKIDSDSMNVTAEFALEYPFNDQYHGSPNFPFIVNTRGDMKFLDVGRMSYVRAPISMKGASREREELGHADMPIAFDGNSVVLRGKNRRNSKSTLQRFEFDGERFQLIESTEVDKFGRAPGFNWIGKTRSVEMIADVLTSIREQSDTKLRLLGIHDESGMILTSDNKTQLKILDSDFQLIHDVNPFLTPAIGEKKPEREVDPRAEALPTRTYIRTSEIGLVMPGIPSDRFLLIHDTESSASQDRVLLVRIVNDDK